MKTDKELQQAVMQALGDEAAVSAARIGVGVSRGVVTLTGEVGHRGDMSLIARAVNPVVGVKLLIVRIMVRRKAHDFNATVHSARM